MKKIIFGVLVCLLLCLTACSAQLIEEDLPPEPTIAFESIFTTEQITNLTGIAVTQIQNFEDGSIAYFNEDFSQAVYMSYSEMSLADFDVMLQGFAQIGSLVDAPNLSEKAVWCENSCNLLIFENGKALDIQVQYDTARPNDSLLAARQLGCALLESL